MKAFGKTAAVALTATFALGCEKAPQADGARAPMGENSITTYCAPKFTRDNAIKTNSAVETTLNFKPHGEASISAAGEESKTIPVESCGIIAKDAMTLTCDGQTILNVGEAYVTPTKSGASLTLKDTRGTTFAKVEAKKACTYGPQ